MSSSKPKWGALSGSEDPEEDYDMVDYYDEIGDGDDEQQAREGLLLQQDQPQASLPHKNPYIKAMSNLLRRGEKVESVSEKNAPGPSRRLVSHEFITTLSPELADRLESQVLCRARSIMKRAGENLKALRDLLSRVPDGQHELKQQISRVLRNEQEVENDAKTMEEVVDLALQNDKIKGVYRAMNYLKRRE